MRKKTLEILGYQYPFYQYEEGYRYSIDSLLLSAFVQENKKELKLLEVGVGSGVISVLLGKRLPNYEFYGFEVQEDLYNLAKENFELNHLKVRLTLRDMKAEVPKEEYDFFDVLVSNPPFFKKGRGVLPPLEEVALAKHEISCRVEDLASLAKRVLKTKGDLYLIYPTNRLSEVLRVLEDFTLGPMFLKMIHSKPLEKSSLFLLKAQKGFKGQLTVLAPMIVYGDNGEYSEEAHKLFNEGELKW